MEIRLKPAELIEKLCFAVSLELPRLLWQGYNSPFIPQLFLRVIKKTVLSFFNFPV